MTPRDENVFMDEIDELERVRTRLIIQQLNAKRRRPILPRWAGISLGFALLALAGYAFVVLVMSL